MRSVRTCRVAGGRPVGLQPRLVRDGLLKGIDRERPHFLPGVPTIYMAINHAPNLSRYNLRSLKGAISGAAPLPREVQVQFEALTGARLVEGYGLTDASPVTHCVPLSGEHRVGTIGVPGSSTDAAVVD